MFVVATECFLSKDEEEYGQYPVSTKECGIWYTSQDCQSLKLKYHIHFFVYSILKEQFNTSKIGQRRMF